jgi:hypothetical protein
MELDQLHTDRYGEAWGVIVGRIAPLFVTLGATAGDLSGARTVIDGFWYGLAKRSIEVA